MSTMTTPAQAARQELTEFRGRLIGPGDGDYEEARAVYNAMIDKRPALIARCADADDVATAVGFARAHGLLLAVRGGGHNGGGLGTCDDGVVIDLSLLRDVQVDAGARTVRVGGGCTWAGGAPPSGSGGAARGPRSTPRRASTGSPRRAASSPRPASAASRSAAGSGT